MFLKRLRPSIWLSALVLSWGLVTVGLHPPSPCALLTLSFQTLQGLVQNYEQLLGKIHRIRRVTFMTLLPGVNWLLGMAEAGLFPGVSYYLSWCVPTTY